MCWGQCIFWACVGHKTLALVLLCYHWWAVKIEGTEQTRFYCYMNMWLFVCMCFVRIDFVPGLHSDCPHLYTGTPNTSATPAASRHDVRVILI